MTAPRFIMGAFIVITLIALAFASAHPAIDCNDPATWGTASGVQHCAINPEGN